MSNDLDLLIDEAALHGLVSAPESSYANRWQPEEDEFVRRNWGWLHIDEIARHLGRSANAVDIHRDRYLADEIPATTRRGDWLTAQEVGRRLGTSCVKTITRLISEGLLPARMAPLDRAIYLVSYDAMIRFAANPENWIYFKPHRVRDAKLRRFIHLRQQRWNDEWWTPGQVAAYHGVSVSAASNQIYQRCLPAKRWGNWWVKRSDAINARFVRGKGSKSVIQWTDEADAFLILARAVGLSWGAIERMCKWQRTRAPYRVDTLVELGRLPAICHAQGVLYDPDRGLLLADWRNHQGRFPLLTRAARRFVRGGQAETDELSVVVGVLSVWGRWYAQTPEQDELAETWRHYAYVTRETVDRVYQELLSWGVDPLKEQAL